MKALSFRAKRGIPWHTRNWHNEGDPRFARDDRFGTPATGNRQPATGNRQPATAYNPAAMAAFLLMTTLLTIAGLVATIIAGYLASPGHVAQHIMFALSSVVIGLFSQSMTMFFFIGTGKEIKDKVKGTGEEKDVVQRTRDFKSRVFPTALYAMLAIMTTFILGGGVASHSTPIWLHNGLAFVCILLYGRAYWVQLHAMDENARLMERYLSE
jgi:hypothetical protein